MLDYDRKVTKRRSDHEPCHSNNELFQDLRRTPVPTVLPDSMLLGLCYSTFQSLKGTQKEKYGINTLYDKTIGLYGDLYHLENLNRRPCASRSGRLYTCFHGDINLCINLRFIILLCLGGRSHEAYSNRACLCVCVCVCPL